MENKIITPFHPTKALSLDEAARLMAAYDAATTDQEREELLREAKIRILERRAIENARNEQEADHA